MRIAHILWSMGTGGTENMVVDIASVQAENNEVCIFVINLFESNNIWFFAYNISV